MSSLEDASLETGSLACSVIVYRLARARKEIEDDGTFKVSAFYRRDDEDGLSVQIASRVERDERNGINPCPIGKCYGIATLHAGHIRNTHVDETSLDVIPIPDISDSEAEIIGVPCYNDDPFRAERFADLLADQARPLWQRPIRS